MDKMILHDYCMSKMFVICDSPFGPDTVVYRIGGKIFAIMGLDAVDTSINLKCDPTYAENLRAEFIDIIPGYHMNKKHWNTVYTERGLKADFICSMIDHSYDLVFQSLSKKAQSNLLNAES